MNNPEIKLGLVGATGLVGETVLDILEQRDVPVGELRPFASERSVGESVRFVDNHIPLRYATSPALLTLESRLRIRQSIRFTQ